MGIHSLTERKIMVKVELEHFSFSLVETPTNSVGVNWRKHVESSCLKIKLYIL